MHRMKTKEITIGNKKIGGGNEVLIQSMTNTKTEDVKSTVDQILKLESAGCDIIRCAVPTMEAAKAVKEIKKEIHIPLVADIHFDYRLAIAAIENGADVDGIGTVFNGGLERREISGRAEQLHSISCNPGHEAQTTRWGR